MAAESENKVTIDLNQNSFLLDEDEEMDAFLRRQSQADPNLGVLDEEKNAPQDGSPDTNVPEDESRQGMDAYQLQQVGKGQQETTGLNEGMDTPEDNLQRKITAIKTQLNEIQQEIYASLEKSHVLSQQLYELEQQLQTLQLRDGSYSRPSSGGFMDEEGDYSSGDSENPLLKRLKT